MSIEHYKWFFEEQSMPFWIPDGIKKWSWLTIITWPNNTWKTTIIEALLIHTTEENYWWYGKDSKFQTSERHEWFAPMITITFDNWVEDYVTYTNIDNGSQVKKVDNEKNHWLKFSVIQSRRYWTHKTGNQHYNRENFDSNTRFIEMRNPVNIDTAAVLTQINKDSDLKHQFDKLLSKIIPNLTTRTIDTDDDWNDYIKYNTWWGFSHNSWLLWDWIISIFRICAQLILIDNSILIIDEPELSLHPQAQKKLSDLLSEEAKDRQIIICTHSPYFVKWNDFINWAKFIRLNKYNDTKCSISFLDNRKDYLSFLWRNILEYQKPQLLDVVSKEIMFSEHVLFVEWPEDVWLLKKFSKEKDIELKFDIFWYWVWWYSNMKFFLEIAHDLWLEKVWILYDNWPDTTTDLQNFSLIYQTYHFEKLETDDIRDKPIRYNENWIEREAKVWIFDAHWDIKEEYEDYLEKILIWFNSYFNE